METIGIDNNIMQKARDETSPGIEYVNVEPNSGQYGYFHGKPMNVGTNYSFNIPSGQDFAYDMTKSCVSFTMDITLKDTAANVLAGTSIFGKKYRLQRTHWKTESYKLGDTLGITRLAATNSPGSFAQFSSGTLSQPQSFKKTWLNPGPESAFSFIDNATINIAGNQESVSKVYRLGAQYMESIPKEVQRTSFPTTFFDWGSDEGDNPIEFDTCYYNYVADGLSGKYKKVLVQTTVPVPGTELATTVAGNLSDSQIDTAVWAVVRTNAGRTAAVANGIKEQYIRDGWNVYNRALDPWNNVGADSDTVTFTHQVRMTIPLNLLFSSLGQQTFYAQTFNLQNQFSINIAFQPYAFAKILGGLRFVDANSTTDASHQFQLRTLAKSTANASTTDQTIVYAVTVDNGFFQQAGMTGNDNNSATIPNIGTGLTNIQLLMAKIPMKLETPNVQSMPLIQKVVVGKDIGHIVPNTWYNNQTLKIESPHESVNKVKLALQLYDPGFNGNIFTVAAGNVAAGTSVYQSGRRSWVPFNAMPTLLNMGSTKALSLLYFYNFRMKYGSTDIFQMMNNLSNVSVGQMINIFSSNAQANYFVPSNADDLLFDILNYGCGLDINTRQLEHINLGASISNDGINTKIASLSFSNQMAVYGNPGAAYGDSGTVTSQITEATDLTYYMPALTDNTVFEWCTFYTMYQKYFPTSSQFRLEETKTDVM